MMERGLMSALVFEVGLTLMLVWWTPALGSPVLEMVMAPLAGIFGAKVTEAYVPHQMRWVVMV